MKNGFNALFADSDPVVFLPAYYWHSTLIPNRYLGLYIKGAKIGCYKISWITETAISISLETKYDFVRQDQLPKYAHNIVVKAGKITGTSTVLFCWTNITLISKSSTPISTVNSLIQYLEDNEISYLNVSGFVSGSYYDDVLLKDYFGVPVQLHSDGEGGFSIATHATRTDATDGTTDDFYFYDSEVEDVIDSVNECL